MQPLLSIIIPSKNRYGTLLPVLDSLLSIGSKQLEIVVQDNSDDNSMILDYFKKNTDNRLAYFYTDKVLSQTGNSDQAVLNSRGEYVCFIGDDDGVMPYIIEVVKWMKKNEVKAIKSNKPFYHWPGLPISILDKNIINGTLNGNAFNYKINKQNTRIGLKNLLDKGGTDMSLIPCLYHGIVNRKVLDQIFEKTESYFPGPSPDMANAVSLSLEIEEYYQLDFPVIISGRSVHSIGGQGVLHNHISQIKDVPHLPKNTIKEWDERIPKYWTGETIWAESALKALKKYGELNLSKKFNYTYLYARIILFSPQIRKTIFSHFPFPVYTLNFYISFFKQLCIRVGLIIKNKLFRKKAFFSDNLKDMEIAVNFIMSKVEIEKIKQELDCF